MPTSRTFQLDIDTKRYLARVNVYRKLNGIGPILPQDAADIDNFVVGLKDLGVWGNTVCWLTRSAQNIGTGTSFLPIGGGGTANGQIIIGAGANSSVWESNGIRQLVSTSGGGHTIGLISSLNNVQTQPYSLFGCCNVNNGGFYHLGADALVGVVPNSRKPRIVTTPVSYDLTTAQTFAEGQFFLTFLYISKGRASIKNNDQAATSATSATNSYVIPPLRILSFGTNYSYYLNYGHLVTQAIYGVCLGGVDLSGSLGTSFYTLYKTTAGRGLPSL